MIGPFFGANATAAMGDCGEQAFKRQLYMSMISQVMYVTICKTLFCFDWGHLRFLSPILRAP